MFDYDEVNDICKMSLSKFNPNNYAFRDEMAEYFTQYIFDAFDTDLDEEIPLEVMREEIFNVDSEHRVLLAMFCCAEDIMLGDKMGSPKSILKEVEYSVQKQPISLFNPKTNDSSDSVCK